MGILNVTPDSFSDGGKFFRKNKAIEHGINLIENGANIIDIGGESSRPGSLPITTDEELKRVIPVISSLRKIFPEIIISIDTYKADVAKKAIEVGADIVNDISAMRGDLKMVEVVSKSKVPIILMHMRGKPANMQNNTNYNNIIDHILIFFKKQIEIAKSSNVSDWQIILDPGIGFGKNVEDNFKLLKNLDIFCSLGYPVLIGTSRKSFLGKTLSSSNDNLLEGTISSCLYSIFKGARILRVHDVREIKKSLIIIEKIMNS